MRKTIKKTSLAMLAVSAIACVGLGSAAIKTVTPASATTTKKEIFMAYGASVRLADDFNGLRFKMAVTPDYFVRNNTGKYGMIIIPFEYLSTYATALEENGNDYVKTFAEENVQVLNFTDMQGYAADEEYNPTTGTATYQCFNGIISFIKYDNLDKDFVAIGYYNDGTTYDYATFNEEDNVRNVVKIANAALEENAQATTDIYTADQVLRLYEYEFLNNQNTEGVSETEANDEYTAYKEGLKTQYVSSNASAATSFVTVGQGTAVNLTTGDKLTMEFDVLDVEYIKHPNYDKTIWTGLVFGTAVYGVDYAHVSENNTMVTTYIYGANDTTWRLYSKNDSGVLQYSGEDNLGVTEETYSVLDILAAGKSVKMIYKPYYADDDMGTVEVWTKEITATEWTKAVSYENIAEANAPKDNVCMAFFSGNCSNITLENLKVTKNDTAVETTIGSRNVTEGKGNTVTVIVDGEVKDTAFVRLGKAYTPDESLRIEDWTLDGETYDINSPVMKDITLEGTVVMPEFYNVSINTTQPEFVWFSNDIALEEGKNITFEYTVKKVQCDGSVKDNGMQAFGSDDTKSLAYTEMASKYDLATNASALNERVLSEGIRIKIVFEYDEEARKYNWAIYHNGTPNLYSSERPDSEIDYNEYFGMTLLRFLVSIELEDVKCYDSDGKNLGVSGGVKNGVGTIIITPKDD